MNISPEQVVNQEERWLRENEPTFSKTSNGYVGKVGRLPSGEDILIQVNLPEFYPIMRPDITVLTPMTHPNIDANGVLSLQILDEWDPSYRLRTILMMIRRLFFKSQKVIKQRPTHQKPQLSEVEVQVHELQEEIARYDSMIRELKTKHLSQSGINTAGSGIQITVEQARRSEMMAIEEIFDILEEKFEYDEIGPTDFFKLYRSSARKYYILMKQLESSQGVKPHQVTKEGELA